MLGMRLVSRIKKNSEIGLKTDKGVERGEIIRLFLYLNFDQHTKNKTTQPHRINSRSNLTLLSYYPSICEEGSLLNFIKEKILFFHSLYNISGLHYV